MLLLLIRIRDPGTFLTMDKGSGMEKLFNFPAVWNAAGPDKIDPRQHIYVKNLQKELLLTVQ